MSTRLLRILIIACAVLPSLGGCGGGGSAPPRVPLETATPVPTTSPTSPPAGALTLSQSAASFDAPGESATVMASETAYSGPIGVDAGSCGTVVSVTPSTASAPARFTVSALASGSCTLIFTDQFGQTATLSVGVTVTQGKIQ